MNSNTSEELDVMDIVHASTIIHMYMYNVHYYLFCLYMYCRVFLCMYVLYTRVHYKTDYNFTKRASTIQHACVCVHVHVLYMHTLPEYPGRGCALRRRNVPCLSSIHTKEGIRPYNITPYNIRPGPILDPTML